MTNFESINSLVPLMDINAKLLKKYLHLGYKKTFLANSYILKQGEIGENIYYLNNGKVKIILFTAGGEEKLFWYGSEGTIIGDVPFFHSLPSNAAIIAQDNCELYVFNKKDFSSIIKNNPEFAEYLLEIMARKIRVLINQIQDISFYNPTTRISKLLYLFAQQSIKDTQDVIDIKIKITHKEIGALTSIHRVTVTNVLSNLKRKNVIEKSPKGIIIIKDLNKLQELAFEHSKL